MDNSLKTLPDEPLSQLDQSQSILTVRDKRSEGRALVVEQLFQTIEREAVKRRKRRVRFKWLAAGAVVLAALLQWVLAGRLRIYFAFYWMILGAVAVYEVWATRREREAARKLAALDDPRAVGSLADALELQEDAFTDKATILAIRESLTRLLERGDPDLTTRQVSILADRLLAAHEDPDLLLGVLRVVRRHRHVEAKEAVEPLIELQGETDSILRVRESARECLAALEEEERRSRAAQTLLRPSAASGDAELLRPVASDSPAVDNLLRASEASGNPAS